MAGLSDFFGAEQKRKRKLFKGEGYPESAAKRAEDRAAALAKEKDRAEARAAAKVVATEESTAAEKVTAQGQRNNERAQRIGSYTAPTVKPTTAKFGVGNDKTVMHNGRSMANVTAAQLKETGLKTTEAYMRRWDKTGTRPSKTTPVQTVTAQGQRDNERAQRTSPSAKSTAAAEKVTAQGQRDNERAQRTSPSAKRTAAEIARRRKSADAASKEYIEEELAYQRDPERRDNFLSKPGAYLERVKQFT
jgi:hypothetical protein